MTDEWEQIGQYWMFDLSNESKRMRVPSIWVVDELEEDDRGEGPYVSLILVSMPTAGQPGYKHIGDSLWVPMETLTEVNGWTQIAADDIPLLVLGGL